MVNGKQCNILGISPKDIYELPREYWSLSKNAYVCYSSIKYGKVYILEDDGLYLAVPGYSSLGEQILAEKKADSVTVEITLTDSVVESELLALFAGKDITLEIVLDNGCRLMAEATTINSGISFTFHCVLADEFAHIQPNIMDKFYNNLFR